MRRDDICIYVSPAEPRHPDWFTKSADDLFTEFKISRAAADPAVENAARDPGGWNGLLYFRLHGSPRAYYLRMY
jgi:uncharacterized protein YecE (DUF72 family)